MTVTVTQPGTPLSASVTIKQYPRYRGSFQIGVLRTDLRQNTFGTLDTGDGPVIVNTSVTGNGPEYVGSILFYGLPNYLTNTTKKNYFGRDITNDNDVADKIGLILSVSLDEPEDLFGIGLAYELIPGVNLTANLIYRKQSQLAGVSLGDPFTGMSVPVRDDWEDDRHLCAVIAQMADGQINPRSNRLNAAIQIGQRGYSRYDKESAIQIANAADALSHRSLRGWVTLRDNILRLSSNAGTGTVVALDVSEEGLPVEANEQRSLIQFGDPLPSSNVTLHSPTERIDILRTDSQRFHYAESLWQDENGLHLLTQEKLGIDYPVEGGGPQFDMSQAPAWLQACPCGIDQFGLWAELNIAGMGVIMRWIGPGKFDMGSPDTEHDRHEDEVQHLVTLSEGYWLAETSCTQALWLAVMGGNPSHFKGANRPVDSVSWDDVQRFLQAVNVNPDSALQLVLPTEAQWEFACRVGTQTPFNLGATITPDQVNYDGNYPYGDGEKGHYREETVDVKSFAPNAWGLYQMHGNVWEWCNDWYGEYSSDDVTDPKGADTGDYRVLRGGGWIYHAQYCRSAIRRRFKPSGRDYDIGFRFAQVTPAPVGAERPQAGETKAPRSGGSRGRAD